MPGGLSLAGSGGGARSRFLSPHRAAKSGFSIQDSEWAAAWDGGGCLAAGRWASCLSARELPHCRPRIAPLLKLAAFSIPKPLEGGSNDPLSREVCTLSQLLIWNCADAL